MTSLISSFIYLYFIKQRFWLLKLYGNKPCNCYFIKVIGLNLIVSWLRKDMDKIELESEMNNGNIRESLNLRVT